MRLPSLTEKEALVMELLTSSDRELYGMELVRISKGALLRGTVYITLSRLEEKEFIKSREEPRPIYQSGLPRRLYKATESGRSVYRLLREAHRATA